MEYRELNVCEIDRELFSHFRRHQTVTKCWRRMDGNWCVIDAAFVDDWSEEEYKVVIDGLKDTLAAGGVAFGAFSDDMLKGFASVEAALFGKELEYLDLTNIHVSEDMRGKGIGKELFRLAKRWAREHGAVKLYISAHSSIESQSFYRAMGCVEAQEYNQFHVEKEPYDCQLECTL